MAQASDIASAILSNHDNTQEIINNETARLNKKKQSVDDVITSKERMIQLNNNYIERMAQYQKMMIALIIGLAIWFVIFLINRVIPIPSAIFTLILIIVFVVIGIYCFNVYLVIINRDPMNFDKLNIVPPVTTNLTKTDTNSNGDVNLLGALNLGLCYGSSCCSTGTVWDISAQLCVDVDNDSFEPRLKVNSNNFRVENQNIVNKFSPSEFETYSIYK